MADDRAFGQIDQRLLLLYPIPNSHALDLPDLR